MMFCVVIRIRLNCVGVFDVVSFDPNLQSGSTQMERYKVSLAVFILTTLAWFTHPLLHVIITLHINSIL